MFVTPPTTLAHIMTVLNPFRAKPTDGVVWFADHAFGVDIMKTILILVFATFLTVVLPMWLRGRKNAFPKMVLSALLGLLFCAGVAAASLAISRSVATIGVLVVSVGLLSTGAYVVVREAWDPQHESSKP